MDPHIFVLDPLSLIKIFRILSTKRLLAIDAVCKTWFTWLRSDYAQRKLWLAILLRETELDSSFLLHLTPDPAFKITYRDLVYTCVIWSRGDWPIETSWDTRNVRAVDNATSSIAIGRNFSTVAALKLASNSPSPDSLYAKDANSVVIQKCVDKYHPVQSIDLSILTPAPPPNECTQHAFNISHNNPVNRFLVHQALDGTWLIDSTAETPPCQIPHPTCWVQGNFCICEASSNGQILTLEIYKIETSNQTTSLNLLYRRDATAFTFNNSFLAYIDPYDPDGNPTTDQHTLFLCSILTGFSIASNSVTADPDTPPTLILGSTWLANHSNGGLDFHQLGTLNMIASMDLDVDTDELAEDDDWIIDGDGSGVQDRSFRSQYDLNTTPIATVDGMFLILPNAEEGDEEDRSRPPVHRVVDPISRKVWRLSAGWRRNQRGFLALIRKRVEIAGMTVPSGDWELVWRPVERADIATLL
ncbi:hypothetical protein HK097_006993 [Rhizophlyctis rosea]|uniref:F-box domain-containing protein n=1 Tax=Rhizophlyctis rosea TaxID=64517 RepID=A0AAD5SFD7_9FUNG|nr:hypothetical protein HK097_006993 [Rhizophlyctis rosea]